MTGTPGEPIRLATALRRLEEIVRALEAEDTDLDQGLVLFEEGVGLLREARARLETAELKVQQVLQDAAGDLRAADMDV
jgi:exodeoxyribonuclease VII small subunit